MSHDILSQKTKYQDPAPHVHLNILGRFDLRVNGQLSEKISRSGKLKSVLCYLILHRDRAVTQTELIETFWENENQSNPLGALKMQILRIRNTLEPLLGEGIVPIISHSGSYQWNPELNCWVDAEEFERLCLNAEHPTLATEEKISLYDKALALYAGEPELGKANLSWIVPVVFRYHSRYITAVIKFANLLAQSRNYFKIAEICRKALEIEPTNEELHILMIQSYLQQKKQAEALKHYKNAVDILHRDLGVHPSQRLQDLYSSILKEEPYWQTDLDTVIVAMRNTPGQRNAFLCSFEQFKSIYQLEVRRAPRIGGCLHIAMITVSGTDSTSLSSKISDVVMDRLEQAIVQTLRQSDVVARYSKCQFIIMLPYANLEDSSVVVKRIMNAYYAQNPKSVIQLSYQIRELELT